MTDQNNLSEPWFKQFWAWFVISLPATVVVASVITVMIAINNEDSLVADDYYKEGLAINQVLALDKTASELALSAQLRIDQLTGDIIVTMAGNIDSWPEQLELFWVHPTDKARDFSTVLTRSGVVTFLGQLERPVNHRWYVQLASNNAVPWRLKKEIDLAQNDEFLISALKMVATTGTGG